MIMELPPRKLPIVEYNSVEDMVKRYLYGVAYERRLTKIEELEDSDDPEDHELLKECIEDLELEPDELLESVFDEADGLRTDDDMYGWYIEQ